MMIALSLALLSGSASFAADVADSPEQIRPLLVGASIPDTALRKIDGSSVSLHQALAEKPTVLIFYRGGW